MDKNSTIYKVDLSKIEEFCKFVPKLFFANLYDTKLNGQGLIHQQHSACEYDETSFQQHCIVVHLKPEQNSLRRLGDTVEIENVNIGDAAIIPAHVNHWQRIDTEVSAGIILTIDPDSISHIAHETINPDKIELLPTFAQPDPFIQHLTLNLKANLDSDNYDLLYAESLFQALSMHLIRHYATRQLQLTNIGNGLPPYKLKQALNYINDNLDQPITLKDIAQLLDLSQYYFCHLFKESTGIAPYKYVIKQRIEKAKYLIKNSQLPLADISYECGFSSQSQMTQHFRKCVGVTPKVYFLKNQ